MRMSESLKIWLGDLPNDWLNEENPGGSVQIMQSMIESMRLWLRNIPEHCLIEVEESSEDLKSESKSEPIMLVQNYQELQEYPGQLVDQTMPEDFPEMTEGQVDITDINGVVGAVMKCHEDVPVSSHEDGAFIEDHGYQITLELEEQNTRELSEDFGGLENNESCSLDVKTSKSTDKKGKKSITTRKERKKVKCDECDFVTLPYLILRHKKTKHNSGSIKKYPCDQCAYIAYVPADLRHHTDTKHKSNIYSCDQCTKTFSTNTRLQRHKDIHAGVTYPCSQCNYSANAPRYLKSHIEAEHKGIVYPCDQCNKKYNKASNLKMHKKIHEGVVYSCDQCDYFAHAPTELRFHIDSKHKGIVYPCGECTSVFNKPSNLKTHMKKHEGIMYPCELCDYSAGDPRNLKQHKQNVHEAKKYHCVECPYKASTNRVLNRHIESRH